MPSTQESPTPPGADMPPHPAAGAAPPDEPPPRSGRFVGVIVGAVVACAVVMVGFIWYRWQAVREPTTAVIVAGDATFDGTVVTVAGPRTITTELSAANDFVAPVLLEPGWHRVTVRHRDRVLIDQDVEVKRFLGVRFRLADLARPATTPPTRPAAHTSP